jgi:ATP-binding cassette subfamily B protein
LPSSPVPGGDEQLRLKGALLVRIRGRKAARQQLAEERETLSPELAAAVMERPAQPSRDLMRILWDNGILSLVFLVGGLIIAATGVVFKAVLLRSVMGIAADLQLVEQRLAALGYFLVFTGALFLIEWRVAGGLLRLGRFLEVRLRVDFLKKIPLLNDRYFKSRPISGMAERSHNTHHMRLLPWLCGQFVRTMMTLVATTAAICWLDPNVGTIGVRTERLRIDVRPATFASLQ